MVSLYLRAFSRLFIAPITRENELLPITYTSAYSLQSWNRNYILVLRKPDIPIGVIIALLSEPVLWNLQGNRSYLEASEQISGGIIDENAKQEKCHGKTTGHRQATG